MLSIYVQNELLGLQMKVGWGFWTHNMKKLQNFIRRTQVGIIMHYRTLYSYQWNKRT